MPELLGANNIAIGIGAMQWATTANGNVAIGVNALANLTTGSYNIAIGNGALEDVTTESYQVQIGDIRLYRPLTPMSWWQRRKLARELQAALFEWVAVPMLENRALFGLE